MTATETETVLRRYFDALNRGDSDGVLACVAADMVHDVNEGERRFGRDAFRAFLGRIGHCYKERLEDLTVLVSPEGARAAAEYNILGTYLHTDEGLPTARGQPYALPGGTFFALSAGQISRVTSYYNLTDWLIQVTRDQP